jgi:hypothetical protein
MRAGLTTVLAFALAACTSGNDGSGAVDASEEGTLFVDAPHAGKDASREDASVGACARGGDCFSFAQASDSVYCCTDNVCTPDTPGDCSDANVQLIQASNYDRSCSKDTDCVWMLQGNACHPIGCGDPAAINMGSYAQYQSDIGKTRAASCDVPQSECPTFVTCCRNGSCGLGATCVAGDAAAHSGDDGAAPADASGE